MASPIRFQAIVKHIERHDSSAATYLLDCAGKKPRFKPGQFVRLTLEDYDPSRHWPESRCFSIASAPAGSDYLRLTISLRGSYTSRILAEITEGRTLWLKGPYGDFIIRPKNEEETAVLIAGGTGITPFCSYMEEALLRPDRHRNPVALYYVQGRGIS